MEIFKFTYPAERPIKKFVHVGVVGSGNLEVLLEPAGSGKSDVEVTTSQDGNVEIWNCILERFFAENPICVRLEINDFGATPGVVMLRLMQALELTGDDSVNLPGGERT